MTFKRIYSSVVEESNALVAIADKRCTQSDVAETYADAIIADKLARRDGRERVSFAAINAAILKRWPKGLTRVKEKAWKMLESHHA